MPKDTKCAGSPAQLLSASVTDPVLPALDDWASNGLCIGEDPDTFFPTHGSPAQEAKDICGSCAVRPACLDYALKADEYGIWGGLDQNERRNLKRRQRRAVVMSDRASSYYVSDGAA